MLSAEDVSQQQGRLAIYRTSLGHLLMQAAQFGGETSAPLPVMHGIRDAREHILEIKTVLRTSGIEIEDHPDDIPPIRRDLDEAVGKQAAKASENDRSQVLRRAQYAAQVLQGAQLLWVDDNPDNNIYERRIFRSLGIFVDLARSSEEAISMLQLTKYDVIISDLARGDARDAGLQFLDEISKRNLYRWTILYTGPRAAARGVPPKAFAITARPDHLLHYVIDAIERERI
jgi:CheY-like chemotaxis protein